MTHKYTTSMTLAAAAGALTLLALAGCRSGDGMALNTTAGGADAAATASVGPRYLGTLELPATDAAGPRAKAGAAPLLNAPGRGLDIKVSNRTYFDLGGYRYYTITLDVRNGFACNTPGSCTANPNTRTNLTLLPLIRSFSLAGTPVTYQYDASGNAIPAGTYNPQQLLPTHGMTNSGGTATVVAGQESLQLYSEDEVATFPLADIGSNPVLLDYGFVVRNKTGNSRTLAANPAPGAFDGTVTIAYKAPLTASTPARFGMTFGVYDNDANTRVSQSLEEANAAGDTAGMARAALLSSLDLVTPGARVVSSNIGDPVCSVRTAGTTAAPAAYLINNTAPAGAVYTSPALLAGDLMMPATALRLGFCQPMAAPTPATLLVSGSISGPRMVSGANLRTATFSNTVSTTGATATNRLTVTPTTGNEFLPGETVTYTLATSQKTAAGANTATGFSGAYTVGGLAASGGTVTRRATVLATGPDPAASITALLNNDTYPDLVVANAMANTITVYLGTAAGLSTTGTTYATGAGPRAIVAVDLNGDGALDLATANSASTTGAGTVSVLIANATGMSPMATGTGTFKTAVNYAAGTGALGIVSGDFNKDTIPDLVTADADGKVYTLLGSATTRGTFGAATATAATTATTGTPLGIATADFNNDTYPDVVVSNSTSTDGSVYYTVLLPGSATGAFGTPTALETVRPASPNAGIVGPAGVAVGDFNGDTFIDIAVANQGFSTVSFFPNSATGFNAVNRRDVTVGLGAASPTALVTADANGDGVPDLVASSYRNALVSVLLNGTTTNATGTVIGTATFADIEYSAGPRPGRIAVADYNADGLVDLAVPNGYTNGGTVAGNSVNLLYGRTSPRGTFGTELGNGNLLNYAPRGVVAGDFNGDNIPDIAVVNSYINSTSVTVMLGSSSARGTFASKTDYPLNQVAQNIATADLNGDGILDLVTANRGNSSISVLLGSSTSRGTFGTATNYSAVPSGGPNSEPNGLAVADFNGDGFLDVAVSDYRNKAVLVLMGSGTNRGAFGTAVSYAVGNNPAGLTTGDFDGDGVPDLAVVNQNDSSFSVLIGSRATPGTFQAAVAYPLAAGNGAGSPTAIATGDVNGDKIADLVIGVTGANALEVRLGSATTRGTFLANAAPSPYNTASSLYAAEPSSVSIGDMNGDNIPDLVAANNGGGDGGTMTVLLGSATTRGTFTVQPESYAGPRPTAATLVDLNGDKKLDVITAHQNTSTLTALMGN